MKELINKFGVDPLGCYYFKLGIIGQYKGMIYHYTSVQDFDSILFSDNNKITLWASRYDCLNDMNEGKVALKVYENVCDKMLEAGNISKDMYDIFISVGTANTELKLSKYSGVAKNIRLECDKYVCSFSRNSDSLAMWNYYTKGNSYEGFNIGVNSNELLNNLNTNETDLIEYKVSNVFYGEDEQEPYIMEALINIVNLFSEKDKLIIRHIISLCLEEWSLIFKSEYFKHEQEVRLIIKVPKVKEYRQCKVKYRNSCGYTIPYIEIKLNKDLFIKTTIGPLMCSEEQKKIQKEILQNRLIDAGLERATTNYSRIPVRY